MAISSPTGKPLLLRPIHPNIGIEKQFKRKLEAMIAEMQESIEFHLLRSYEAHEPVMAADSILPSVFLNALMKRVAATWLRRFTEAAPILARYFTGKIHENNDVVMKSALRDAGFSVKFQTTKAMQDVVESTVHGQVSLIKSIAQEHLADVEELVMRSVQAGRDLGGLKKELQHRYKLTNYRSGLIAQNQNNVASAMMQRARQKELGITEAVWMHSHGGRKPRESHVAFSGHRYDIDKGAYLDGVWTWPGKEINCRCVMKSVIPALDNK